MKSIKIIPNIKFCSTFSFIILKNIMKKYNSIIENCNCNEKHKIISETFSVFLNHFRVKLISTDMNDLVFGTDEELALLNAITAAFPDSGR
jgi:hypothetical protein